MFYYCYIKAYYAFFLIRVDCNKKIGIGHLMRCLTLANSLKSNRIKTIFITTKLDSFFENLIKKSGHDIFFISKYKTKISFKKDALLTKKFIESNNLQSSYLIVDNYELDIKWESLLKNSVKKIIIIDDLANRKHDCDFLIDQNFQQVKIKEKYKKLIPKNCKLLLGPKFALLRPEFRKLRETIKIRTKIRNVLVSFGGNDHSNETFKVLKATQMISNQKIKFFIVVGNLNPNKIKIKNLCQQIPNATYFEHPKNISKIMYKSDLAIGAGGTTTWERCCMGLPSIISISALNQKELTNALSKKKLIINLGNSKKLTSSDYKSAIESINPKHLQKMSKNCLKLVDGNGIKRILEILLPNIFSKV